MKLIDDVEAVIGDIVEDSETREMLLNNISYYIIKYTTDLKKTSATIGYILGFISAVLLLRWLA